MFQQVKKFMTTIRELENQERIVSVEEKKRGERLREALSTSMEKASNNYHLHRYVLVIAGFYPQAGASFIASNLAYHQAGKQMPVTLCELPAANPYYYFALNSEERGKTVSDKENFAYEKVITMQYGLLRVKANTPFEKMRRSFPDITSWVLGNSKDSSLLIVDISSYWKEESASWVMNIADEIWFVMDTDIPRFARTVLTEEAPKVWGEKGKKVRLIANKWNHANAKSQWLKKVEGTLAFWNAKQKNKQINLLVPAISSEKIMNAHYKGKLLLEVYPEEGETFEQLSSLIDH